jgi:threonine dehydrogenase-like Zn-dependent dehydrogenase
VIYTWELCCLLHFPVFFSEGDVMACYPVVLVGCGSRGAMHAEAVLANPAQFVLLAVCDRDPQRLETLATRSGIVCSQAKTRGEVGRQDASAA